jgi:ribose transport system permease protein
LTAELAPQPGAGERRKHRHFQVGQEHIVGGVTVLLVLVSSLTLDGFATVDNLLTLLSSVAVLGIIGAGLAIVVIGGGLDLSIVAAMSLSTGVVLRLLLGGESPILAVMAGLAVAVLIGLLNGLIVAFLEIPAFFTTLAMGLFIEGIALLWILEVRRFHLPNGYDGFIHDLGASKVLGIPAPIIVLALVLLVCHLILTRTVIGPLVYAQGDNPEAAAITGVRVRPWTVARFVIAACLALLAGLVTAGQINGYDTGVNDSTLVFNVVLVVVLGGVSLVGGRGSMLSVLVGALLIGVVLNGMTLMNIGTDGQALVQGVILLAALTLDSKLHPRDEETARQGD